MPQTPLFKRLVKKIFLYEQCLSDICPRNMSTTNGDGVCAYYIRALYGPMRWVCAVDISNVHDSR